MKYPITCQYCGNQAESRDAYEQKRKKHCSRECRVKAARRGKLVNCTRCGKETYKPRAQLKKNWENSFCSRECRQEWGWSPKDPEKRSLFVCEWCEQEFEEWTYRNPRFCSSQCVNVYAARLPKPSTRRPENFVKLACEECGEKFRVHKCIIENPNRNPRFCCADCKNAWMSRTHEGENNPNWTGGHTPYYGPNWVRKKREVRKRDNYTCQQCGAKESDDNMAFDVHHKIPLRLFDDYKKANAQNNLILLCRQCHTKADANIRKRERAKYQASG